MKSANSRIQSSVNKNSNKSDNYAIGPNIDTSETVRSKSETEPGRSLAYYLDFYNKKHRILQLENNQNNLNKNLKSRKTELLLKTNNHLLENKHSLLSEGREMNKHFKMGDRSFTLLSEKSSLEFSTNSQNNIISNYKADIDNLKYKLADNQQDLVKDFIKFSKSNSEQVSMAKKHIQK
jgi:hypothetical protein